MALENWLFSDWFGDWSGQRAREMYILEQYYRFYKPYNLATLAARLGISPSRASDLKRHALIRIARAVAGGNRHHWGNRNMDWAFVLAAPEGALIDVGNTLGRPNLPREVATLGRFLCVGGLPTLDVWEAAGIPVAETRADRHGIKLEKRR